MSDNNKPMDWLDEIDTTLVLDVELAFDRQELQRILDQPLDLELKIDTSLIRLFDAGADQDTDGGSTDD